MTVKKNYIPRNDALFNNWYKSLTQYVGQKAGEWDHIPAADRAEFIGDYAAWYTAYSPLIKPHTPVETKEKNRVRKASEKLIREFVNRFLRYRPVTDSDRDAMGIPNHDTVRTDHMIVAEEVEFNLLTRGIRQVHVEFRVLGATNRAKPRGYDGAVVVWDLLDGPPAGPESLNRHTMASRTPHTLDFSEAERGKTVYVAVAWQNERGILGRWSEIQRTIVP